MQEYKNLGGNSGVVGYSIGDDYVEVKYIGGRIYKYSYHSADVERVEKMKKLAMEGKGLNSYISQYARYDYEK